LILKSFTDETVGGVEGLANRLKPLDVVKVLMGINSDRINVKRF